MYSRLTLFYAATGTALILLMVAGCSSPKSVTNALQGVQIRQPLVASTSLTLNGIVASIVSPTQFIYQSGYPHGHVPVLYSSSTLVPAGSSISVGQVVSVTGSFNAQGQLIANAVTTTVNLSGSVSSIISPTEFIYQTGNPHGHVSVVYSASMVSPSGARIRVGEMVTVTGTLTGQLVANSVSVGPLASPTPTASPSASPTPVPTGPYHVATWALDSYWAQGENASATSVNQLVSYAEGNGKSPADCHSGSQSCKAVFYLDPNHSYDDTPSSCMSHPDGDVVAAASEDWFVHDAGYTDSAHRVHGKSSSGCVIWEFNPNATGVQSWWRSYLRGNADTYDEYIVDNDPMELLNESYFSPSGGGCLPWPTYCYTTQEIANDAAEVQAHANFVNAMSHSDGSPMYFFYQQASLDNVSLDLSALTTTNRFIGVTCEGCIATTAIPVRPTMYAKVLNEMAAVNAMSKIFMLISDGESSAGSSTQILQRLVTTGVIWLGYSEGHTIVEPNLEAMNDNLAVWPEDLIYPSGPIQSMVSGANDLEVAPGVWRREFTTCYQAGRFFGRCAAIVNSTGSALPIQAAWLSKTYGHVVTLSGGDALSGGTASVGTSTFVPNVTTIGASAAVLLAQ